MKNASLVEAIFVRSKIKPNFTYLWKTIPEPIKTAILERISLNANEKPILSFYVNSDKWWLLTTERIILSFSSIKEIDLNNIKNIELDKLDGVNKLEINTIQLEVNSVFFDLEVKKRTWHVIFKMLQFMLNL